MLWCRADMLAWARRHPEFADGASGRATLPPPKPIAVRAQTPARRWASGKWTMIEGLLCLFDRPRRYVTRILVLPALLGAGLVGAIWSAAVVVPAFVVLVACIWVFQYFFLQ